MKKIAFWYVVLLCGAWGLEIKPASLTISPSFVSKISAAIDTITLTNTSNAVVSIDTVTITFLNGDSADFRSGIGCTDYSCFNYGGWSYGASSHQALHYLRDSLYMLQDVSAGVVRYTLQPHDSLKFIVYSAINCPVCGRMPSFPKTTRFRFDFIGGNGVRDSFLLNLENPTATTYNIKQKNNQPVSRLTSYVNLRGQSINTRHSSTLITSVKGEKLLNVKIGVAVPGR
jgi:hypothetical protein